jgi:DNA-binding XRE family transcriptional regulator
MNDPPSFACGELPICPDTLDRGVSASHCPVRPHPVVSSSSNGAAGDKPKSHGHQGRCTDAVLAAFVFLDLLESDADPFGQVALGEHCRPARRPNSAAEGSIDRISDRCARHGRTFQKYTSSVCSEMDARRQRSPTGVDHDLTALGRAIRARRKQVGLSQEALAERAGLHSNYIGMIERGQRNPSATTLFAVAKALGLSLATLVEGL